MRGLENVSCHEFEIRRYQLELNITLYLIKPFHDIYESTSTTSHSQAHLFSVVKAIKIIIEQPEIKQTNFTKPEIIKSLTEFEERLTCVEIKDEVLVYKLGFYITLMGLRF